MRHILMDCLSDPFRMLDKHKFLISNGHNDDIVIVGDDDKLYIKDSYAKLPNGSFDDYMRNVLDMSRKSEVSIVDDLVKFGFNVPKTFYSRGSVLNYLYIMEKDKRYVIKSLLSARSLGKTVVDHNIFMDMIEFKDTVDKNENIEEAFNKKFVKYKGEVRDESEEFQLYRNMGSNNIYVQEYVEDIEHEYRVIYAYGTKVKDYLIEERINYGLENMEDNTEKPYNKSSGVIPDSILTKIKEFGDSTNKPFLSFDIYITKSGEVGLFEYSTEFYTHYRDDRFYVLKKQLNKAMELIYDKIVKGK